METDEQDRLFKTEKEMEEYLAEIEQRKGSHLTYE